MGFPRPPCRPLFLNALTDLKSSSVRKLDRCARGLRSATCVGRDVRYFARLTGGLGVLCGLLHPWQFVVLALAGWIKDQQLDVIEYLKEETRVLRVQLKGKRIRFTDDQRRGSVAHGSGGNAS